METINWQQIIKSILASGKTQPQIAEECGCGQSTVSALLNGKTTDPRTSTGLRLLKLADAKQLRKAKGSPKPAPEKAEV